MSCLLTFLKNHSPTITSIASVVIALCAFMLSIIEAKTSREHDKLSVMPSLNVSSHYNDEGTHINIRNVGLGPAVIGKVLIELDGEEISNWRVFAEKNNISFENVIYSNFHPDTFFPAEPRTIKLFGLKPGHTDHDRFRDDIVKRTNYYICYCSIYKDCWVSSLNRSRHKTTNCGESTL